MDIVVVGSAVVDLVAKGIHDYEILTKNIKRYVSIPYGSKIETDDLDFHVGGSGRGVAANLANLGDKVSFVGKVGKDFLGKMIIDELKQCGVDVKNLKIVKNGRTGLGFIFLLKNGERSIIVYNGKNLDLSVKDIPASLKKARWFVFASLTSENSLGFLGRAIAVAKKNNVKILANPSIRMIKMRKRKVLEFIKKSNIALMNEEEIKELTGSNNIIAAMKKLNKLGAKTVVVTLDERGAIAFDGKKVYHQKGFKIKAVDTTGCGDSFTAGFLHYIRKGKSISEALKFGNASAALEIQDVGPRKLSEKEVLNFISNH